VSAVPRIIVAMDSFRAPGHVEGAFGLERAMDALARTLGMDPLELRRHNYAARDQDKGRRYSAKHLDRCYSEGAERFGWAKRNPEPGSMRDGDLLVGWGMATATYPAHKMSAVAKVHLNVDGSALVQCATHDLGTGAYTAFTQASSELLGVPFEQVTFELREGKGHVYYRLTIIVRGR